MNRKESNLDYREFYLRQLRRMPAKAQRHLLLCDADPDNCVICALIKAAIERLWAAPSRA